jgi:phosphoserine phosphatase RsbU/P
MQGQAAEMLRGDLVEICANTTFLVIGLTSCAIAALRRRGGVRVFLWIGIWSASYGLMHLLEVRPVQLALPPSLQAASPYVIIVILYGTLVIAACAWLELTVGRIRQAVSALIVAATITAVLGIGWFVATGVNRFITLNNLLAVAFLLMLLITLTSRRLFEKYLLLPNRGFLLIGTVVFTVEALCANLMLSLLGFRRQPIIFDHLGFLILLVAFGYSGLKMVLTNEHRLLEIQTELELARQIQTSILPTSVPEVRNLRISATYRPAASVAGDFYEFLPVDGEHAGFLVADVCGHGVPAALIASMLKVAVQSVAACADDPGQFLAGLNRVLAEPLRGQLVSASYLWVDMQARRALYSAAGHPPLLRCNREVQRIESNGLLFGIVPEAEYPVCDLPLCPGDRLLLYTDGVTEPENAAGEAFGDVQLERLLAQNRSEVPGDFSQKIVTEIQSWQRSAEPQDDMTLIVIDVT